MLNGTDALLSSKHEFLTLPPLSLQALLKYVYVDEIPSSADLLSGRDLEEQISALGEPPPSVIVAGDICSSKSLPESKSAELGISSTETCFSKACRANGGKVRNSCLLDRSASVPFSIASRSLFLSAIRPHRIELQLNLRVPNQFTPFTLAQAGHGLYPPLAEDLQNGFLVLIPVQLFVSQKQRRQSDIKIVSR